MPDEERGQRPTRRLRADVGRNLTALVEAATTVFADSGVTAPAKAITDLAGVGVGTLYRHFPRRSDLILAVLDREIDACVESASAISATHEPFDAITAWVDSYVALVATKHGLAEALHSADPAYEGLTDAVLGTLEPVLADLMDRAATDGVIRPGTHPREVLVAVALLCQPIPGEAEEFNDRLVRLFVDGLRPSVR